LIQGGKFSEKDKKNRFNQILDGYIYFEGRPAAYLYPLTLKPLPHFEKPPKHNRIKINISPSFILILIIGLASCASERKAGPGPQAESIQTQAPPAMTLTTTTYEHVFGDDRPFPQ
jgi:hypothetical protein